MGYCADCGCKVYNGYCTNCNESNYIEEQYNDLEMEVPKVVFIEAREGDKQALKRRKEEAKKKR